MWLPRAATGCHQRRDSPNFIILVLRTDRVASSSLACGSWHEASEGGIRTAAFCYHKKQFLWPLAFGESWPDKVVA